MPAEFLDTLRAAEVLGISSRTLEKWRITGGGPPYLKIGRAVRYRRCDLEAWATGRKFSSTSEYIKGGADAR